MSRRVATLVVLASLGACDEPTARREGDPCSFDPAAVTDDCRAAHLYCAAVASGARAGDVGRCRPRPGEGEVCDPAPCDVGLHCHVDKRCGVSRAEGEPCGSSIECAPGLGCNHGELPDNFALGSCRPPAANGAPCGFAHAPDELIGEALPADYDGVDRGDCASGLACTPLFPAPGTGEPPPMCAYSKGVACFFAGRCEPLGSLADGAPCGRPDACASGVCAVFEPPLSVEPMAGFGPGGDWLGPHVGTCVAADDAIDACGRGHACAEDFTCLDRHCIAPHSQRPGALCSDVDGVECAFGLVCTGRECRYPAAAGSEP